MFEEDRHVNQTAATIAAEWALFRVASFPSRAAVLAAIDQSAQDDDPRIRVVAGSALDCLTNPPTREETTRDAYRCVSQRAQEGLTQALRHPNASVRILAAKGLYGQTVSPELIATLRAAARDRSPGVSLEAGASLAWLAMNHRLPASDKEDLDVIIPVAIQALEGSDPELKQLACPVLAKSHPVEERTVRALAQELSSHNGPLRLTAGLALQELAQHGNDNELAAFRAVIPDLRRALVSRDLSVGHVAVECLRRIGRAVDEAQDVLDHDRAKVDPDLRDQMDQALDWIAARRAERRHHSGKREQREALPPHGE